MKKMTYLFLFAVLSLPLYAQDDFRHVFISSEIMVFDRPEAAESLVAWAENAGGYFTERSEQFIRFRVPDQASADFREVLDTVAETVLTYNQRTEDLREAYQKARSAIEAREEILQKNLEYLDSSDLEGTLELEREIRRLRDGIDSHKGALRKMEHDRSMAMIEVSLQFRQRSVPGERPSNFPWINSVDFYNFMQGISPAVTRLSFAWTNTDLPDGFAPLSRRPVVSSISAEGILLRVRGAENYPEQTQEFWRTALSDHLSQRGYLSFPDAESLKWDAGEGFNFFVYALPWGYEDFLYVVGLRVAGQTIEIIELAGPAESVVNYLD